MATVANAFVHHRFEIDRGEEANVAIGLLENESLGDDERVENGVGVGSEEMRRCVEQEEDRTNAFGHGGRATNHPYEGISNFFTMRTNSRINVSLAVVINRVSSSDPGTERE